MKIAARRRLALGVLATSSALVAGVLIAPSSIAAPGGLTITPNGAVNTDSSETITFNTKDADLTYGGVAVFTRIGEPATFEVQIDGPLVPGTAPDRSQAAEIDVTDVGDGVPGGDGPADAGTYSVSVTGNDSPFPVGPAGGGNDTCTSCFSVLPGGEVAVDSVGPSSVRPGSEQNVSVLGDGFERSTKIEMLLPGTTTVDPGVNANNPPKADNRNDGAPDGTDVTDRTELLRRIVVAAGTEPGARDVRVTNLDIENGDGREAVCSRCFFVAGEALTSLSPTTGFNDPVQALTRITFNGTNIADGTPRLDYVASSTGSASRSDLTLVGTNVQRAADGTSISADFDLRNAAPGDNAYQPIVESEAGVVNACDTCRFTVMQRDSRKPPTLESLDRSRTVPGAQRTLRRDESATFVAKGTNFAEGTTLVFAGTTGTGLTVTAVEFIDPETLEVTIAAASNAEPGDKDPQARLTDNKANSTSEPCDNCLLVVEGADASPSPSSSASPMPGNESFAFERFAGSDRYTTAALVARGSFTSAETVLLANGESDDPRTAGNEDHFPDALAGAYLAGERKAPTLLTTAGTTPQATRDALQRLGAKNVVLLGGTAAISAAQEAELRKTYTVTRLGGQNRYDTAKRIATTPATTYVGEDENGDRTAVVASGEGFADALVSGPLGYAAQFPLLITAKDGLSEPTREALDALDVEHVLIPGGTGAVSQKVQDEIEALGLTTRRFAGTSRTETAALVADYAYDALAFEASHVDLARGDRFPDALAGGPHAGVKRAPIVLTASPNSLGAATEDLLRRRGSALTSGDIFGGLTAVSQATEDQAEKAVREGTTGGGEPSPSPEPSGSTDPSASPEPSGSADPSASPDPSASADPPASADPSASASASAEPSASASP